MPDGAVYTSLEEVLSPPNIERNLKPSEKRAVRVAVTHTSMWNLDNAGPETSSDVALTKRYLPPRPVFVTKPSDADAVVIQLWEGRVLSVDDASKSMQVLLSAKVVTMPDHTAQIELQWVAEQDLELVRPGAVFYLTLYRQLRKGSVKNAQELRFRRRPTWSKQQIQSIANDAEMLVKKMRATRVAE